MKPLCSCTKQKTIKNPSFQSVWWHRMARLVLSAWLVGHRRTTTFAWSLLRIPTRRVIHQTSSAATSFQLWGVRPNANAGGEDVNVRLEQLQAAIDSLFVAGSNSNHTSGQQPLSLNVHSPKQVSQAVFGRLQSTSRQVLQDFCSGSAQDQEEQTNGDDNSRRQQLAALILEYRQLARQRQQQSSSSTATSRSNFAREFSTVPVDLEEDDDFMTSDEPHIEQEEASNTQFPLIQDNYHPAVLPNAFSQDSLLSAYELEVQRLFDPSTSSQIHPHWKDCLLQVTRQSARALVAQLHADCPMGYDPVARPTTTTGGFDTLTTSTTTAGKKGSFLAFCREQKARYPDAVLLTRCGDFYETFGIDAIMLVEHCGLNAMAGKAKAGCPIRNVQAVLDDLTAQGFTVAVYEEGADTDASAGRGATGGSKARIKQRFLAQMVSAAAPTYLYDLVLSHHTDALDTASSLPSRPYVGILSRKAGYTLVEVHMEEQCVTVSERLTAPAVACRLAAYPPADPVLYVPSHYEYKKVADIAASLPWAGKWRTRVVPPTLVEEDVGMGEREHAKEVILSAFLQQTQQANADMTQGCSVDDFRLYHGTIRQENVDDTTSTAGTQTQALHVETATQLGLMKDPAIPDLVQTLVPVSAPAATRRFLRRWLLTPPPPEVAEAMATLVRLLKGDRQRAGLAAALPPLTVPPIGKVLALLRAGQASAQVYGELLRTLHSTILAVDDVLPQEALESLLVLLQYESGLAADAFSLQTRCVAAMRATEEVIHPMHHATTGNDDTVLESVSDSSGWIPLAFLERNELSWRCRVRPQAAPTSYQQVERAAHQLAEAVRRDFWLVDEGAMLPDTKTPIVQDIFNNLIALKEIPSQASDTSIYFHPRDRNGKVLRNRYTTQAVQDALSEYVTACDLACRDVSNVLVELSQRLYDEGHIPAVVQAAHANLILSTAYYHAAQANSLGWNLATAYEPNGEHDSAGHLRDLWPYWIPQTQAVANTFDLNGMWILTAPNMSGKSTLMRSTAAAVLLTVCGLCAPLQEGSRIRRIDHLFVRGASADVPSEQKSAFGAEMGDVAALLRCCGERSLVFVDELGRGTSPRDGTRLAGAVLEAMAVTGMTGIFATHLHDILDLPLRASDRIIRKKMAIHDRDDSSGYQWTYRLEDGVCTDSMALVTAERFGLPPEVIARAESLSESLPEASFHSSPFPPPPSKSAGLNNSRHRTSVHDLSDVAKIGQQITGQRATHICPSWNAPAAFDGGSCVYVCKLNQQPVTYYVGETDNIRQRLQQHRSKGGSWAQLEAIVLPIPEGKSQARCYESLLIQELAKVGVSLRNIADGRSIRPARLYTETREP